MLALGLRDTVRVLEAEAQRRGFALPARLVPPPRFASCAFFRGKTARQYTALPHCKRPVMVWAGCCGLGSVDLDAFPFSSHLFQRQSHMPTAVSTHVRAFWRAPTPSRALVFPLLGSAPRRPCRGKWPNAGAARATTSHGLWVKGRSRVPGLAGAKVSRVAQEST